MIGLDSENQDVALNVSSLEVQKDKVTVCTSRFMEAFIWEYPLSAIKSRGHWLQLCNLSSRLMKEMNTAVFPNWSSSGSSRSLSDRQDALDLLTEGVLCLQNLCLSTLSEAKSQWDNISCIFFPLTCMPIRGVFRSHTPLMPSLQCFCSLSRIEEGVSVKCGLCALQNSWPLRFPGHPYEGDHSHSNFTASVVMKLSSSAPKEDAYIFVSG